jgi:hypothetical protein
MLLKTKDVRRELGRRAAKRLSIASSPCRLVALSLLLGGCADNQGQPGAQRQTADSKQESVLKDPMGYGGSTEKVDITGGGISNFDKKSFNKDVDTVFNP